MKTIFLLCFILFQSVQAQAIKLAITVDDLPDHGKLPFGVTRKQVAADLLAVFKKHQIPEVYGFINAGKKEDPEGAVEIYKMWREAGYPLGNHTYTHLSLTKNAAPDFIREIDQNEEALKKFNGTADWKYFRYPYLHEGDTLEKRNAVRKYLLEKKYQIAQVTVDFNDWAWNNPYARCQNAGDKKSVAWLKESYLKNADEVLLHSDKVAKAVFKRDIPHVLLLHVGALDAKVMDQMLTNYKKLGVQFIPLSEAQKDPIYQLDPGVIGKWGSELQYQVLKSRGQNIEDLGMKRYDGYPEEKLDTICGEKKKAGL